jgi:hypothetical protein
VLLISLGLAMLMLYFTPLIFAALPQHEAGDGVNDDDVRH